MNKRDYKPRLIDRKLEEYLNTFGAVCVEGPKWCGKTWSSSYHSNSEIMIGNPDGNFQNRQLAEMSPALVLEGKSPRLIDEWQEVPPLWDAVRYKVDQSGEKGQFILTGSATPNNKRIQHASNVIVREWQLKWGHFFRSYLYWGCAIKDNGRSGFKEHY